MDLHRHFRALATVVGFFFVLHPGSAPAQQISFDKQSQDETLQLNYQWQDTGGTKHSVQFGINKSKFLDSLARFRNYERKRANRELAHQLNRYIKQQRWRGVNVQLSPRQRSISITPRSATSNKQSETFRQQTQKLKAYYVQQWHEYLQANHYRRLQLPFTTGGIIPDAVSIAELQRPLLNDLVSQLGEILKNNSRRNYTNLVGQFIQSIPYNALQDGIDNRGDGFLPPNQVLFYNQGDCDSKASLMAAVLRTIMPQQKMAIIYLPGHALFAVQMPPKDNDATVTVDGTTMVLMEVAGPSLMAAGTIAVDSQFYIDSGQFTAINID
ncbi:transglutaminase-like domain-containing protein [Idiomarina seosinensis]|uniref:hypothetical protein n=1 Tax=Idiomarina seosinensis TaxID=281739 RepID=UPI0038514ED1